MTWLGSQKERWVGRDWGEMLTESAVCTCVYALNDRQP